MISMHTGVPASTMLSLPTRHGLNRLSCIDRPTGRVIRRYERAHPGELGHPDIKKVGKIPPGGGWRVRGRGQVKTRRVGYTYLHCAVDDHSRVAYVEAHDNEQGATLVGFWTRAQDWFWAKGMTVDEVMSDNGSNFRSRVFAELLAERGIKHHRTRPYRPQTNGKVERFNRTMADEFLYSFTFRSEKFGGQKPAWLVVVAAPGGTEGLCAPCRHGAHGSGAGGCPGVRSARGPAGAPGPVVLPGVSLRYVRRSQAHVRPQASAA